MKTAILASLVFLMGSFAVASGAAWFDGTATLASPAHGFSTLYVEGEAAEAFEYRLESHGRDVRLAVTAHCATLEDGTKQCVFEMPR